ncbi:MAG: hypothetical protein VXZ90_03385, partial [Planctomycetota bacterium]|nr:hypothetical protein [Planctomycetota bacterium]
PLFTTQTQKSTNNCQQRFCNIDLTAAYVNAFSFSWDIPHTERNEPSTRRRHGLVPVGDFLPFFSP